MWAQINNDTITDTTATNPAGRFHPSIVWTDVPDTVIRGAKLVNGEWVNPELAPKDQPSSAPTEPGVLSVTKRQGRQQIVIGGLDEQVQTAIDGITDATERKLTQIWYDHADPWESNHPQMVTLSTALGLDEAQRLALFEAAALL